MSKLKVTNLKGESQGEVEFPDDLLVSDKGTQAVHDAVVAHQAAMRAGTASTKKRGEVSGGGAKPYRQKGTGRARAGSSRSPIWRGGGTVFGPQPRGYDKKLNKKTARLAFARAFSDKVTSGDVRVLEELAVAEPKTRVLAGALKKLDLKTSALIVVDKVERNLALASRNLPSIEVVTAANISTYEVLRYPVLLVTKPALAVLQERLQK